MGAKGFLAHKVKILGHQWIVHFHKEKDYRKAFGDDSLGICETLDKEIHLRIKKLKAEVVVHELVHAYMEELCTTPAGLEPGQGEEVAADLFAKYGRTLLSQSDQIIQAYEMLRERVGK